MRLGYNKYRNKPCVIDGHRFPSIREGRRYQELRILEKAGEITDLKLQIKFPLWVNGDLVCTYIADFIYKTKSGKDVTEDSKGVLTPVYRIKKNLMWAINRIQVRET